MNDQAAHLTNFRKGDLRSFRWIYDREHPRVYGFSLRLLGSPMAAEEVTSDVFVRLWQIRADVDTSKSVAPLLFKITRDYAWNYLKRESRINRQQEAYQSAQSSTESASVESELVYKDYLRIAESAIDRLPERQREIFRLRYEAGCSSSEIASRLNLSESTVRVQLARASQFLRQYLESHPELLAFLVVWSFQ